jgi:hypothetical protein
LVEGGLVDIRGGTMNTRDIEELDWGEQELGDVFITFVRRHRRLPSRTDLERLRWERLGVVRI